MIMQQTAEPTKPQPMNTTQPSATRVKADSTILSTVIDYVDHPDLHEPNARFNLFEGSDYIPEPQVDWYFNRPDHGGSQVRRQKTRTQILTADQERIIFLRYNYARLQMNLLHDRPTDSSDELVANPGMTHWYKIAMRVREQIAAFNLALVLSLDRTMHASPDDHSELIADGNVALLRAIDKFQLQHQYRFATFARRVISNAMIQTLRSMQRQRRRTQEGSNETVLQRADECTDMPRKAEQYHAEDVTQWLHSNAAQLTQLEAEVIERRFGFRDPETPCTLGAVGEMIGISAERVRQIQNQALAKFRLLLT